MNKFPQRLKHLRVINNLTQERLSNDIRENFGYPIAKSTISQYENGNREPNISMLINLSKYFACSVDYLVGASDHLHIIESSEFSNKVSLLKLLIDSIPKMDYLNAHELNELISNYLNSNDLK